jgi:hypothetical protein
MIENEYTVYFSFEKGRIYTYIGEVCCFYSK